jgi:hypothetical protein
MLVSVGLLQLVERYPCAGFRLHVDYVCEQKSSERVKQERAKWKAEQQRRRDEAETHRDGSAATTKTPKRERVV